MGTVVLLQAPVGGRYFRNKKRRFIPHRFLYVSIPKKNDNTAAVRQCSSTYGSKGQRSAAVGTVVLPSLSGRAAVHHPPTTHPPPTMHPRTYPVQQYSNAAVVRRAIHLTGEQPICWLQCSRAGRDSPLLGQAKSARVADSAHGERRRLDAGVIGPGVVVLAVDAGALAVSCPWLCPWLKWPKSNSKVQYSWSSK